MQVSLKKKELTNARRVVISVSAAAAAAGSGAADTRRPLVLSFPLVRPLPTARRPALKLKAKWARQRGAQATETGGADAKATASE